MKKYLLIILLFFSVGVFGQQSENKEDVDEYHDGGFFSLGLRNTTSLFSSDGNTGMGVGGQFRLGLTPWLNTEWFLDYITADLFGYGKRTDAHIGWSVLFYPFKFEKASWVQPYIIAGHCFDYTEMRSNNYMLLNFDDATARRWSSAVQAGLGVHIHASEKVDVSLNTQYMMHLGNSIGADFEENVSPGENPLHIHEGEGGDIFEGHLLVTFSLNINIADLW